MTTTTDADMEERMERVRALGIWEIDHPNSFKVEDNGHTLWFEHYDVISLSSNLSTLKDCQAVHDAWVSKTPLKDLVEFKLPWFSQQQCNYCQQRDFLFDGFTISCADPCPYPDGMPIKVEIEIPSGKILFGNDFRDKFPIPGDEEFYVNAAYGIGQTVEAAASINFGHFFVGNSCPSVFRKDGNRFTIANPGFKEDIKGDEDEEYPFPGENVGSVITDLWWVSFVDGGEANKRGLDRGKDGWSTFEVEVEPGTYVLDYYALLKSFDRDDYHNPNGIVYADLTLKDY